VRYVNFRCLPALVALNVGSVNIGAAGVFTIVLSFLAMAALVMGLVLLMKSVHHRH
jgi:hypothetical protein